MPAKGDGITKRKDGRYMARHTVQTPDGPKRKTIYGKRYKDVEKELNEVRANADQGLIFDAGKLTVGEYLERWLSDSVKDTVRTRTYERYESLVRVHIVPALGRVKLKALTPAHVRGLVPLEAGGQSRAPVGSTPSPDALEGSQAGRGRRPHTSQRGGLSQAATAA